MKPFYLSILTALLAAPTLALAGEVIISDPDSIIQSKNPVIEYESNLWDPSRPDSHAPIGVMGDHTHEAGEFMISYRYMQMAMGGHRAGTDGLTSEEVFAQGFGAAATSMDMHMHMLGLMFAPTDWLTLMAMTNYIQKDMHLTAAPMMHGAMGHGGHAHTGNFGHSSEGFGDTSVGGLIKIYDANRQRIHLHLGMGLPTADVDQMQDGSFLPYGMQLGRGTWSFIPGITYLGQADRFSWGAQALANFQLEDENESGFQVGDSVNTTGWLAYMLSDWLSVSARLNYFHQDDINGHYNGPHGHVAPPHFQPNYGGDYLEGGFGLNFYGRKGLLKGQRIAAEVLFPLAQDLNGVGMERDLMFTIGLQRAF